MRFLPGKTVRSQELQAHRPSRHRLRAVDLAVLGIWVAAAVMFLLSPNFKRSRLQAEEATRKQDYMDPVETIPGFRHLYSYSTDTSGKRSYF